MNWGCGNDCDEWGKPLASTSHDYDFEPSKHEFMCEVHNIPTSFWNIKFIYSLSIVSDYETESINILSSLIPSNCLSGF